MQKYSILEICMYLEEIYTEKQYTHDQIECGDFAEACITALELKSSLNNGEIIAELSKYIGMSCIEIGEEKCSELFSTVKKLCE